LIGSARVSCERRHTKARRLTAAAGAFLVSVFASLAAAGDEEAQLSAVRERILGMIGSAPCVNLVHCRLLSLGSLPCGGPAEYLAFSRITGSQDELENLAMEYTLLHEEVQRERSEMGICRVLPKPRLACVNGRCRTEPTEP
jgi:hypothetical protein